MYGPGSFSKNKKLLELNRAVTLMHGATCRHHQLLERNRNSIMSQESLRVLETCTFACHQAMVVNERKHEDTKMAGLLVKEQANLLNMIYGKGGAGFCWKSHINHEAAQFLGLSQVAGGWGRHLRHHVGGQPAGMTHAQQQQLTGVT
jgi:hypothetical protein